MKGTLGTGQRFTPKKRTVPVIRFESGIDHIVYQLYGLMEDEPEVAVPKGRYSKSKSLKEKNSTIQYA